MNKCLLLTRVSTKYQDFTPQEEDLKKYANELGYEVVDIISTKESGFRTIERKDGFRQVKEFFATHPDCRTLIITELSRLSRYDDVLIHCKTYFKEHKIQLIVKDINFRLFDENGNYNYSSDITYNITLLSQSSLCSLEAVFLLLHLTTCDGGKEVEGDV